MVEIARAAAKVFNNKIPLLLQENSEKKPYYKKYLKRKSLMDENNESNSYFRNYLKKRKLKSTNNYLMKKVHRNENKWIRFIKAPLSNKLKIINKKLLRN